MQSVFWDHRQIDIMLSAMTLPVIMGLLGSGLVVGILGSVLGMGVGLFTVPVLVLFFHVPIHKAVAASLMAVIAVSSVATSVNVGRGFANMRFGILLEVTAVAGAISGAVFSNSLSPSTVQMVFSIVLVPMAMLMLWKGIGKKRQNRAEEISKPGGDGPEALSSSYFDPATDGIVCYKVKNAFPASIISFLSGGLSGLGLGGGIMRVPTMNLLCKIPMKAASATSNFIMGASAAAGAVVFFKAGAVLPELTALIVLGVLAGSLIGTHILYRITGERLQLIFGILLLTVAVKMFYTT